MVIYKTTNLVNDKIYIGQDKNNNPNYLGSGKKLKRAIKKYGKNNFLKEVIEICDSEELLNEREIFWISYYKSTDRKTGYNISDGSKEGDRRLGYNSLIKKGRYKTWLEKYGKEEADRKHHEWKQKISDYQKIKMLNGWSHTEEVRKKISEAQKGKILTQETRDKMRKPKPNGFSETISKIKKGVPLGPSKRRKPVDQFDLKWNYIKTWESISKVEQELRIYNINAVCKDKQDTAGGYRWKYSIKENE
jgi:group I intron endonuclease